MNSLQSKLGQALLKSLVSTREQKGELSLKDVGGIFMEMAATLSPTGSTTDQFMHAEIGKLARYITDAKGEIFAISTNDKSEAVITDASAHLDEVIKHTEEATNKIMDAADKIQAAAGGIGGEKETQIMDATNIIYDSCTFQDITGQRIRKVIKLLENIEERISKLNDLFGKEAAAPVLVKSEPGQVVLPADDKDLLNGPQLAGQGSSQAEVDALLASLGGKN